MGSHGIEHLLDVADPGKPPTSVLALATPALMTGAGLHGGREPLAAPVAAVLDGPARLVFGFHVMLSIAAAMNAAARTGLIAFPYPFNRMTRPSAVALA
jgi:hypothetical protein